MSRRGKWGALSKSESLSQEARKALHLPSSMQRLWVTEMPNVLPDEPGGYEEGVSLLMANAE